MTLRIGQHAWARFQDDDWAEVIVLEVLENGDARVQQPGTERVEWSHVSHLFEHRAGH